MATTYAIFSSAFHGGGRESAPYWAPGYLISRHRSEQAAIRKYRSWERSHGDCRCGAPILMIVDDGGQERMGMIRNEGRPDDPCIVLA